MKSLSLITVFVLVFLVNNALWVFYQHNTEHPESPAIVTAQHSALRVDTTQSSRSLQEPVSTPYPNSQPGNADACSRENAKNDLPPPQNAARVLRELESDNGIEDTEFNKQYFEYQSENEKLATIANLVPQGSDFSFLQQILASNDNLTVKIAAMKQLSGQSHYAAINTALTYLDHTNEAMLFTALDVLKSSRDTSVIPLLRDKEKAIQNPNVQAAIHQVIGDLERSTGMSMDN